MITHYLHRKGTVRLVKQLTPRTFMAQRIDRPYTIFKVRWSDLTEINRIALITNRRPFQVEDRPIKGDIVFP